MIADEFREWLKNEGACRKSCPWARGKSLQEAWEKCPRPEWMLWWLKKLGYDDARELRLFACWCVRQVWDAVTDPQCRVAVEVAERYARGEATVEEFEKAGVDASRAAYDIWCYWADGMAYKGDWRVHYAASETACFTGSNYAAVLGIVRDATVADDPSAEQTAIRAQADELRRRIPWSTIEPLLHKAAGGGAQ